MALRRKEKRTERSKLDATPPWDTARHHEVEPTTGPYDISHVPEGDGIEYIDLGALRIPTDTGLELKVEVDEQGAIASVNLADEHGHMQLGVFAAPRKDGIWADIMAEIKISIAEQRGTVSEVAGEFGPELAAKLPAPGGATPVRFIGVDGPRWFLRAMLVGAPATQDNRAAPFLAAFRGLVVVRGAEALPVREPVPLSLPEVAAQQIADAVQAAEDQSD